MRAVDVYAGSDGELTKRYYVALEARGTLGAIAVNLFRAQKCSARAKVYRGGLRGKGRYRDMAYDRKQWAMGNLAAALQQHGEQLSIRFGWKKDLLQEFNPWVLYVDLPQGQVSFHSPGRGAGPDYPGEFDGQHKSEERILEFCDCVFHAPHPAQLRLDSTHDSPAACS